MVVAKIAQHAMAVLWSYLGEPRILHVMSPRGTYSEEGRSHLAVQVYIHGLSAVSNMEERFSPHYETTSVARAWKRLKQNLMELEPGGDRQI